MITGGGNIAVERVEAGVEAESAGGRIEFGEVTGGIHAGTRGGGVRVARVSGPMQLDVRDGGIVLAGVEAPLHASSATGGITASFSQRFGGAADAGEWFGVIGGARRYCGLPAPADRDDDRRGDRA